MENGERLARMYYAAYGALCHSSDIKFTQDEESRMRLLREILHGEYYAHNRDTQYEMYDPLRQTNTTMKREIKELDTIILTLADAVRFAEINISVGLWSKIDIVRNRNT